MQRHPGIPSPQLTRHHDQNPKRLQSRKSKYEQTQLHLYTRLSEEAGALLPLLNSIYVAYIHTTHTSLCSTYLLSFLYFTFISAPQHSIQILLFSFVAQMVSHVCGTSPAYKEPAQTSSTSYYYQLTSLDIRTSNCSSCPHLYFPSQHTHDVLYRWRVSVVPVHCPADGQGIRAGGLSCFLIQMQPGSKDCCISTDME